MSKYSLCKHGTECKRYASNRCGFAHRIEEVDFPVGLKACSMSSLDKQRWVCEAHTPKGHPSYDKYVGQRLSPYQWGRILMYIIHAEKSDTEMPIWARMALWFHGSRPVSHFVLDDFSWHERMYDELGVVAASLYTTYSFDWDVDHDDVSFAEALQLRIGTMEKLQLYTAIADWKEGQEYADLTSMHWGEHSRQYLDLVLGSHYILIGVSDEPIWYFVVEASQRDPLVSGGWVPPAFLQRIKGAERSAYQLQRPQLERSAAPYAAEPAAAMPLPHLGITMWCDGSVEHGYGYAAAWVGHGIYLHGVVSLRGSSYSGAEVAELVGIIGALYALHTARAFTGDVVVFADSTNAVSHVSGDDPVQTSGRMLLPLIRLARCLLAAVRGRGMQVRVQWIPRDQNRAHRIAKQMQRQRHRIQWRDEDVWDTQLPPQFKYTSFAVHLNHSLSFPMHTGIPQETRAFLEDMRISLLPGA